MAGETQVNPLHVKAIEDIGKQWLARKTATEELVKISKATNCLNLGALSLEDEIEFNVIGTSHGYGMGPDQALRLRGTPYNPDKGLLLITGAFATNSACLSFDKGVVGFGTVIDGKNEPGIIVPDKPAIVSRDEWQSDFRLHAMYGGVNINDAIIFK